MRITCFLLMIVLQTACNKEALFDGPDAYADDFESYGQFTDLLAGQDRWSFTQLTRAENRIQLDTDRAQDGRQALKFQAFPSEDGDASKASIAKQNMAFWEGETVRISAWYYLEGTEPHNWLFLLDLEEQTAIGAGPGMRLALVENQLRVEHKFNQDDILQTAAPAVSFPRNQWVEIVWEVKLSREANGQVRLWQNGQLLIEKEGRTTLPTDLLYFQQGTKGMYSSVEFGITANAQAIDTQLWVDELEIITIP